MFSCKHCGPSDATTDTVKVNFEAQAEPERRDTEEQRQQQEAELELQRQTEREEAERRRQEAEAKAIREGAEAEARRMQAEQERRAEEARRAEELRRAEEARRREAEEAARAEAERVAEEKRKAAVAAFLKEYGFSGVNSPRKKLMKTNYALHKAAKLGDAELVDMLLLEGADPKQKDSRGKTPAQVATAKNSKGSHLSVISMLGKQQTQPTAGGA